MVVLSWFGRFEYKKCVSYFVASVFLLFSALSRADLMPISDAELGLATAQTGFPAIEGLGFNFEGGGIEIDLDVQASVESIEWQDNDGIGGDSGEAGALILKGVHLGSSTRPISAEQVRSDTPFAGSDLAMIHDIDIETDPVKGMLVTINKIGDTQGNGLDIIVNDIYFGKDLSLPNESGNRGLGLLIEDVSNFVSDDYLSEINNQFGMSLASIDDGLQTENGNYYPVKLAVQPLENTSGSSTVTSDIAAEINNLVPIPGLTDTSMRLDAEFVLHVKKIAVYRENWEAGIEGLLVYQGLDTNDDGIKDTVGPAKLNDFKMQAIDHQLTDGSSVKAIHFSNIDFQADIAMSNVYIGNSQTGSLGAFHIEGLRIQDSQMWIYPH